MCVCVFTYKAVCVLWAITATCTLTVAAVTNKGTKATAVTLLRTHCLSYFEVTGMLKRERHKQRVKCIYNTRTLCIHI